MDGYQFWQVLPSSVINRTIGVDMQLDLSINDDMTGRLNEDSIEQFTSEVRVPKYIESILKSPFRVADDEVYDDLLSAKILEDDEFASRVSAFMKDIRSFYSSVAEADDVEVRHRAMADCKELEKMQQLVGAPIWHTPLCVGTHFSHIDIPSEFSDVDWSWVDDLGKWFGSLGEQSLVESVSLPRTTSQGVLCRIYRQSSNYRLFIKSLMAYIGANVGADGVMDILERMDDIHEKYGFSRYAKSFMQGIRRQSSRKSEPVMADNIQSDIQSNYVGVSKGVQGRIRGIFIPSEIMKGLDKRVSDTVKKKLFYHLPCFMVDPTILKDQMMQIDVGRRLLPNQGYTDEGCVCASDISGTDQNSHRGCFDLWMKFLRAAYPNVDNYMSMERLLDFGVLYPLSWVAASPIMFQKIQGRSTLSGEVDVTVKNNVVHWIIMAQCLSEYLKEDPLSVAKHIALWDRDDIKVKIHGDDCIRYFGSEVECYNYVTKRMTQLGLPVSEEESFNYLKKRLDKDGSLKGICGSLVKNLFGEYPASSPYLFYAGLSDRYELFDSDTPDCVYQLWDYLRESLVPEGPDFACTNYENRLDWVRPYLEELAKDAVKGAETVRRLLERLFYSGGETFNSEVFDELFGHLHFEIDEMADNFGFRRYSMSELSQLLIDIEEACVSSNGDRDTVFRVIESKFDVVALKL